MGAEILVTPRCAAQTWISKLHLGKLVAEYLFVWKNIRLILGTKSIPSIGDTGWKTQLLTYFLPLCDILGSSRACTALNS